MQYFNSFAFKPSHELTQLSVQLRNQLELLEYFIEKELDLL